MKNRYNPGDLDSNGEVYFSWYLDELKHAGYVEEYTSQPAKYQLTESVKSSYIKELKTKDKLIDTTLLHAHHYTADFEIFWLYKALDVFVRPLQEAKNKSAPFYNHVEPIQGDIISTIEIKPIFDQNNMTRLFRINQKWVYDSFGAYIQEIKVQKLFEQSFTPKRYLLTDSGKQARRLKYKPRTLEEFLYN